MFSLWAVIRAEERRDVLAGFATLFGLMTGHAILETARDALFLARIEASQLPWVYLAVAIVSFLVASVPTGKSVRGGAGLALWMVGCAAITVGFVPFILDGSTTVLYAFYLWTAVMATVVLTRLWLVLGGRFTVTQAKRVYAFIGAGSVLGAIVGSGVASLLAGTIPPAYLVPSGALVLGIAAAGPLLLARSGRAPVEKGGTEQTLGAAMSTVLSSPYAVRVGGIVIVSTITLTLVDYVFKSTVADFYTDSASLGVYFGRVYFALNLLSLIGQLLLVPFAIRRFSVTGALVVLPMLLVGGAAGAAIFGGVAAATLLKGADGALRHSLHRTSTELLYVPMSESLRPAAKTTLDILGQRGGQAIASLLILVGSFVGLEPTAFALMIVAFGGVWATMAVLLRSPYVDLFRNTLRETALGPRGELSEIDLSSLESLMTALNSPSDREVRAAIQLLEERDRVRLVPALILYHPSPDVVVHALEVFHRGGRTDYLPIAERLLRESPKPEVRAAAIRVLAAASDEPEVLRKYTGDECVEVSATALVGLATLDGGADEKIAGRIAEIIESEEVDSKVALADAMAHRPHEIFTPILVRLARVRDVRLERAVLRAMKVAPSVEYLPTLLRMVARRALRNEARETLVAMGEPAFRFMVESLSDTTLPAPVRRHLPRTIARFAPADATRVLVARLPVEEDGVTRYKILRALGRIRADHPEIVFDREVLKSMTKRTLRRVFQLVDWRVALERGAAEDKKRATRAQHLLVTLFRDKEGQGIERLFRYLALQHDAEDVAVIYRGLKSPEAATRASSRELLEHVLSEPLRSAVLGAVDDDADEVRLSRASEYYQPEPLDYETLLTELLESRSESVRSLAVYHIGELGLRGFQPRLLKLEAPAEGFLAGVVRAVVDGFSGEPAPTT